MRAPIDITMLQRALNSCPVVRGARREEGSTLVELLVAITIFTAVMGAILSLYRVSAHEQVRIEGGVRGLIDQRNGLERISRELRQATQVCSTYPTCGTAFSDSTRVDFERCSANGSGGCTLRWVRYDCSGTPAQLVPPNLTTRACLRSEAATAAGLGASQQPVVRNLATSPAGVFTYSGTYVTVQLNVVAKSRKNPIVLEDGVRIRNANETPDSGEAG